LFKSTDWHRDHFSMLVEIMKKTIDINPKRKYDITIEEVR
jgi:hypothetical protein